MITDIPTKEDFYDTANHMVNEAWSNIADLAHEYSELIRMNEIYSLPEIHAEDNIVNLKNYWRFARPKLITAFSLVQQSVEFRLKGMIVEISPYLLITNVVRNAPKPDLAGNISYAAFHSLDAQELIKIYDMFSTKKLDGKFNNWYAEMRTLRNKFMHTVDMKSDISAELIFKSIVFAHRHLNPSDSHWIWHRYNYKIIHSTNGIHFKESTPSYIFEILRVHYELSAAIRNVSDIVSKDLFGYDKNKKSYYCKKCVSLMVQDEYFDSKHLDDCIETVQYNRKS